jgi:hypothetical protein
VLGLRVALGVLALLVVVVVALRWRKLRRDESRRLMASVDRRLLLPPPSPYETAAGFRLLDGAEEPDAVRPTPTRPRLEPEHHYVFSESGGLEESAPLPSRHNVEWALARSMDRRSSSRVARRVVAALVVVALVVAAVGYAMRRHPARHPSVTTTSAASLFAPPALAS